MYFRRRSSIIFPLNLLRIALDHIGLHQTSLMVQFLHTVGVEVLIIEVESRENKVEHDDVEHECTDNEK